jgi:glycosidase
MIHADYWTQQSMSQYTAGAIMTPYIGSHDTARFTTLSTYRGQDAAHDRSIPDNKWTNVAAAPDDSEPYRRHKLALAWLLTSPGAPLLFQGDEYGDWGGSDPNNRSFYRTALDADESSTLTWTRALGTARKELPALRRGDYTSLYSTEDVLVFLRKSGNDFALVALARTPQTVQVPWPLAAGMTLHDRLGGPDVTTASQISLTVNGAAIYAP